LKDGETIVESPVCQVKTQEGEEESTYITSLTLKRVTPRNAGKYQINVMNEFGQVSLAVSLIVKGRLYFNIICLLF